MKASELKPMQKKIEVIVKVEEKSQERQVTTQSDGKFHRVCEALVGDETGSVLLSLWDENIDLVQEGKYYKVSNAYTSTFRNSLRLSAGKYGSITETTGSFEVNTANNLSLKELV